MPRNRFETTLVISSELNCFSCFARTRFTALRRVPGWLPPKTVALVSLRANMTLSLVLDAKGIQITTIGSDILKTPQFVNHNRLIHFICQVEYENILRSA